MQRCRNHLRLIILSLMAGLALSACGIRGDLKTPPPLWGQDIRTDSQKAEVAKAKADRAKRAADKVARDAKKEAEAQNQK